MTTPRRPFGITLVVAVVTFQGVLAIVVGLNLLRALPLTSLPPGGSSSATGAAMLIVGIASILTAMGLFTLRFWAYVVAIIVLSLTVFAGVFALIQHGVNAENGPSLVPALISGVVLGYLLSERVRPLFDN